jgi:hypothetical protein
VIASPFMTTGSTDSILYAPAPITGSLTGSPNSNGLITEFDVNAWDNIRVQFQYVAYGKFNGSATNYDGTGRNASSNNTVCRDARRREVIVRPLDEEEAVTARGRHGGREMGTVYSRGRRRGVST